MHMQIWRSISHSSLKVLRKVNEVIKITIIVVSSIIIDALKDAEKQNLVE